MLEVLALPAGVVHGRQRAADDHDGGAAVFILSSVTQSSPPLAHRRASPTPLFPRRDFPRRHAELINVPNARKSIEP
jgi:hypothetical protein